LSAIPLLLVGAGGHARACVDVIEREARYRIVGAIGLPGEVGTDVLGCRVLGTDADLPDLVAEWRNVLITVGHMRTPAPRVRLFELLERCGAAFAAVVSPLAYVSPYAKIGAGTIVMHGAIVNAGAVIGRNCIVNSNALVEHDVEIGDHCHVATVAAVNSGVRIGSRTFIGSGASVKQCLNIGEGCLIGMGQRVLADCPPGTRLPPPKVQE
jgi:sugar O-acyltransferase (sialic acid O-acetyltransferase NeuD family)